MGAGEVTRRSFLQRTGLVGLAAVLPGLLGARGLIDEALAQSADLTHDTLSGLVAFMFPGDDPYSAAQGVTAPGPGGIAANVVATFIQNLDQYVPAGTPLTGDRSLPASSDVATRGVTKRAVGWEVASYVGPAEGHREHLGYWKGRKKAVQSPGYARRRRRQRRRKARRR